MQKMRDVNMRRATMIKRILKVWFTIAMYELGKWIGRELYYKLSANDEVDIALNDYARITDQYDLDEIKKVFIE